MDYVAGPSFGFGFGLFHIMFMLVFLLAFGTVVVNLIRSAGEWNKNNHSPKLTVPATVVTKRTDVTRRRRGGTNEMHHYHTSTTYYVTFQVESGDRMELRMDGSQYGLLVEGDQGKLRFQGTRYLGFERI